MGRIRSREEFEELIRKGQCWNMLSMWVTTRNTLGLMLMRPWMLGSAWCFPWNRARCLQVKKRSQMLLHLLTPPDLNELQERLIGRDRFWGSYCSTYRKRVREIAALASEYDYAIVNDYAFGCRVKRSRTLPSWPCGLVAIVIWFQKRNYQINKLEIGTDYDVETSLLTNFDKIKYHITVPNGAHELAVGKEPTQELTSKTNSALKRLNLVMWLFTQIQNLNVNWHLAAEEEERKNQRTNR